MKNKLTTLEELLLVSVLRDRVRLAALPRVWTVGQDRHEFARQATLARDAQAGIVPLDWPRWRGVASTASQRQANSRAVRRLIAAGLLQGCFAAREVNVRFVALTEAGEQVAKAITSEPEASA